MTIPSWIAPLFDDEEVVALAEGNLHRWSDWVLPIHSENEVGKDITYEDDFEAIKTELAKLSGINADLITEAAERLLKTGAKDLRVAVYYAYGNLRLKGLGGFSDGLELICSLLKAYPKDVWPKRLVQRRAALEWLASEKVTDAVALVELNHRDSFKQALSALVLLHSLLSEYGEDFRPNLSPLFKPFEEALTERSSDTQQVTETEIDTDKTDLQTNLRAPELLMPGSSISSSKMLLDQTRQMSAYLKQQENGYWAAYKMIRAVRWGSIQSAPPSTNGQTRLKPPHADLLATLKHLVAEKKWLDLLDRVDTAFLEGANQYWLDLQYYAWIGQKAQGGRYAEQADSALGELKILLTRCPELLELNFEDGSPFVSGFVAEWLQNQVLLQGEGQGREVSQLALDKHSGTDAESTIDLEAFRLLEEKGLEVAITWLDSHSQLKSGKANCYKFLLMARLAEQQQKTDWAVYLLEHSLGIMQNSSIIDWDRDFSFEIYAMLYRLIYAKSKRKDMQSDMTENQLQIEQLKSKLIQIDAVRALYLFH